MNDLQVRARTAFEIISVSLSELIQLPDQEAAEKMQYRMAVIEKVEEWHERSYAEVGVIAGQFQKRSLWKLVNNPVSGEPFISWSAWAALSGIRCRRIIMESKKDMERLADVPAERLIEVSKGNLKTLIQLSTAVRNQPDILEAARTMDREAFEDKVEAEHPLQHIERRTPMRFSPGRSWAKVIEEAIDYAMNNDIAGNRDEALLRMAETALNEWKLEQELSQISMEEIKETK